MKRMLLAAALVFAACDKKPAEPQPVNTPLPMATPLPRDPSKPFVRPPGVGKDAPPALPLDESDADSLYYSGQQEFLAGEMDKAAEHFRKSVIIKPSAKTFHAMGDALLAQAKFTDAAAAYKDAVKLEPAKRLSWMRLGRALIDAGRYSEAAQAYEEAQKLKADDPDAWREQAEALLSAKREDEAVAKLEKAVSLAPKDSAKDLKLIGEIRLRQGKPADAALALSRSADLKADPGTFSELGDALVQTADFNGAARAWQRSAELDPNDPWPWFAVGEVRSKLKDVDGAREAFGNALKVKNTPPPHLELGRLALAEKKPLDAKKELDLAMAALAADTPTTEIREVARFAMEASSPAVAEKLLAMLATEEDPRQPKKDPALFLELAKARRSLKDGPGVKNACAKAKALLPEGDKTACP